MNCATPELEYWMRFSITCPISGGATSQPSRQPVIDQFLEKELAKITRSPSSMTSRNEGARVSLP
ncbi:hypothetical protein D3C87_2078530 [compost metagenome]